MTQRERFAGTGSIIVAAAILLIGRQPVQARPPHKKALADFLGPYFSAKLNDCRTCHVADQGNQDPFGGEEKPHNPFGARLKAVKRELSKAGKSTSIAARLEAIAEEDSDGDGVPNLLELITGHNPGDANDKPTDTEITAGRKLLAEFLKNKTDYPWTPFDPVKCPQVPVVENSSWVRNPIDAFIAQEHEKRGLHPRPEAARSVLLRRVFLDLTGLPPTPEELQAFLTDPSTDAYEKVVDRLLESPRHGERWGRHWMDIWRYSDWAGWTDGGQIRDSQPHIWRWRDWIVDSLNEDKGYDRMVLEMLAADELAPTDEKALRATGYLVRNYKMLSREKWMQDTVEHTAMAFLGVTLGCARCHDHMFDPILQKEYYQVRAIFEPHQVRLDRIPGQPDTKKDGLPRVYDADLQVPTYLFVRGDDRNPDKSKPIAPGVPEALGGLLNLETVKLPLQAFVPDKREFVIQEENASLLAEFEKATKAFETALREAQRTIPTLLSMDPMRALEQLGAGANLLGLHLANQRLKLAEARLVAFSAVIEAERLEDKGQKGTPAWEFAAKRAVGAQQKVLALEALLAKSVNPQLQIQLADKRAAAKKMAKEAHKAQPPNPTGTNYIRRNYVSYSANSSGRRLAFARWLTDRSNPLTARVAMNHIWMRHFGQAIVPSVTDFGRNGRPPSHPALLDWLAAEFMARGWSMKQMHRLIVTSNTYRMASTPDEADFAIDRDNVYLWRMNSHRLEAEAVRDCIFYVAGKLDLKMGGPDIPHPQGLTTPRRSIYFQHAQEKQMEFLKIFDAAAVTECYRRKESVVPQQALALNNSELVRTQAAELTRTLSSLAGSDDTMFAAAAFERILSRPATGQEVNACTTFLQERTQKYTNGGAASKTNARHEARASLVHVLLNHNDFVTVR